MRHDARKPTAHPLPLSETRPNEMAAPMRDKDTKTRDNHGISIRVISGVATIIAVVLAFYAFALASRVGSLQETVAEDERRYLECSEAINDLQKASDYLTTQARSYVVTGRREYLDAYIDEMETVNRRGRAVEVLRSNFSVEDAAAKTLEQALSASDSLAQTELAAMHLAATHYGLQDLPSQVEHANTSIYQREGASQNDLGIATSLVLDENYDKAKQDIGSKVTASSSALLAALDADLGDSKERVQSLLFQLRISVALLLCVIMILVLALFMYVLKPLGNYVKRIRKKEPLDANGAYELHYLATAYNAMYEDNAKRIEQLRAFAERDPLTGISNRSGYDNFLATHTRNIVLLLIFVDNFSEFTTIYGQDTSNAVLIRLAEAIVDAFRSTDFPCRIESDTFAVIMTNVNTDLRDVIVEKVEQVNTLLADSADDLPLVTLSVGAAFSTEGMTDKDIYNAAHRALQAAREEDANSIVFYGEHNTVA